MKSKMSRNQDDKKKSVNNLANILQHRLKQYCFCIFFIICILQKNLLKLFLALLQIFEPKSTANFIVTTQIMCSLLKLKNITVTAKNKLFDAIGTISKVELNY